MSYVLVIISIIFCLLGFRFFQKAYELQDFAEERALQTLDDIVKFKIFLAQQGLINTEEEECQQ